MDFVTKIPRTRRGNNMIWGIVDRVTKSDLLMFVICGKCKVDDESQILPIQELEVDSRKRLVEEPVELLDRKVTKLRKKQIPMVLVKWKHSLGSNLTWETETDMKTRYPYLFGRDEIPGTESP